jgi:hypothetical protein
MTITTHDALSAAFTNALAERYIEDIKEAIGLRFNRTIALIHQLGGVGGVRRLMRLYATHPSEGYTKLWEAGRLDLSFEALMVTPRYAPLFEEHELQWALQRLADYGYEPPPAARYDRSARP